MVGGRELALRLPLPLVEVWEELQAEVERPTGEAGLRIMQEILDDEVRQPGYVCSAGRRFRSPGRGCARARAKSK